MYEKEISQYFEEHKEEYLRDLGRLIAIDSRQGEACFGKPFGEGPSKALKTALKIAETYGLYTENWENYLGIVQLNNQKERKLDILAHLDVVPANEDEWKVTSPFTMKIEGGKVFGRGAADDKGPALAAIYALRAIRELGLKVKGNPRVVLGCNEESGSAELKYYFEKTEPAEMTISPDASFPVINIEKGILVAEISGSYPADRSGSTEGSTARISVAGPRVLSVQGGSVYNTVAETCEAVVEGLDTDKDAEEIEKLCKEVQSVTPTSFTWEQMMDGKVRFRAIGKAAHASHPETGCNANAAMLMFLSRLPLGRTRAFENIKAISYLFPPEDHHGRASGIYMEDKESGVITVCPNVLNYSAENGSLSLTIDARLPICFTEAAMEPLIQKLEESGMTYTAQCVLPHYVEENSRLIKNLLESYEAFSGKKGYCISMGGLTYCHGIKNAVAFGFADDAVDNRMHGRDEFAHIERLMMGGKIYTLAIIKLCAME